MDRILAASYGDKGQREVNARQPNAREAGRLLHEHNAKRMANPLRENPTPPSGSGPLFWDPKNQGPACGNLKQPARPTKVKVEIRPGVLHTVEVAAQQPSGAHRPARASSAPPTHGPALLPPSERNTCNMAPLVAKVEHQMRARLTQLAAVHLKELTVLLRAFGKVIGKKDVAISVRDKVTPEQFVAVWKVLGLLLPLPHAAAIFDKYGQDAHGCMPVLNFANALVMGEARLIMEVAGEPQRGPYKPGKPATHMGKILYSQCKKGVWPPSDWHPSLADRSAATPDCRLELDFVYGYDGVLATSPNLWYTAGGDVVYYTAAVGIVYNQRSHRQRFFLGHDDDILCLAIHPDKVRVASGQYGHDPCTIVWDTTTMQQLVKISYGEGNRGMQCATFSPDGRLLAAVATDNGHTLHIHDWQHATEGLLLERKTMPGAPPSTYGVEWSRFQPDRLVAYGQNFIKFLSVFPDQREPGRLGCTSLAGVYNILPTHTVYSACFLPSGMLLTGNAKGCICSWKGARLQRETAAHATGPKMRRADGTMSYNGVRCLVLQDGNRTMISGGGDGYVIQWDVSSGDLGPALVRFPLLHADQMGKAPPPALRALDSFPGSTIFVAGTVACNVWEVDQDPKVLVHGQTGDLYGLATNRAFPHIFATVCESSQVMVWSGVTHKPVRIIDVGVMARSAAFSPDGQHLAVGCCNGGIKVLSFYPAVAQVVWLKTFEHSVCELKYSRDGRYLAAGAHDQHIDIFDVAAGYIRIMRCSGHSATVSHLDWSLDGSVIQSNDNAYEVLHFDPRTGKQVKENQRDTKWDTWTCTLGFSVMGIWPRGSDGTDINACDRSPSGRYLLTSDDLGKIKLFNYPCVVEHAPCHSYPGHSSHVMNVRWASDESLAFSVGGKDRATFQWRVMRMAPAGNPAWSGAAPLQAQDSKGLRWAAAPEPKCREAAAQQRRR